MEQGHSGVILAEKLSAIQMAISRGAPLEFVLDAIVDDAWKMMGENDIVGLRMVDPEDDNYVRIVASRGVSDELLEQLHRRPIHEGAGGLSIKENRLVVLPNYVSDPGAIDVFAQRELQTAMAAPVRAEGVAIGSLSMASYEPHRTYSGSEQLSLLAFAEHASLAMAAAKVAEGMRDAERDRQLFMAMLTHKLKTPLTIASGAVELMGRWDKLDDERREMIATQARQSIRDIGGMIDLLLKGSKAEFSGEYETIPLTELVEASCSGFDHVRPIERNGIPDVRVSLRPDAFKQAIGTLLENAVKHSPDGTPITISGRVGAGYVFVSVTNEGSFPHNMEPSELFLPMRQGGSVTGGVGLGLYIVKRLARAVGGDVRAIPGDGHVGFELKIPLTERPA